MWCPRTDLNRDLDAGATGFAETIQSLVVDDGHLVPPLDPIEELGNHLSISLRLLRVSKVGAFLEHDELSPRNRPGRRC